MQPSSERPSSRPLNTAMVGPMQPSPAGRQRAGGSMTGTPDLGAHRLSGGTRQRTASALKDTLQKLQVTIQDVKASASRNATPTAHSRPVLVPSPAPPAHMRSQSHSGAAFVSPRPVPNANSALGGGGGSASVSGGGPSSARRATSDAQCRAAQQIEGMLHSMDKLRQSLDSKVRTSGGGARVDYETPTRTRRDDAPSHPSSSTQSSVAHAASAGTAAAAPQRRLGSYHSSTLPHASRPTANSILERPAHLVEELLTLGRSVRQGDISSDSSGGGSGEAVWASGGRRGGEPRVDGVLSQALEQLEQLGRAAAATGRQQPPPQSHLQSQSQPQPHRRTESDDQIRKSHEAIASIMQQLSATKRHSSSSGAPDGLHRPSTSAIPLQSGPHVPGPTDPAQVAAAIAQRLSNTPHSTTTAISGSGSAVGSQGTAPTASRPTDKPGPYVSFLDKLTQQHGGAGSSASYSGPEAKKAQPAAHSGGATLQHRLSAPDTTTTYTDQAATTGTSPPQVFDNPLWGRDSGNSIGSEQLGVMGSQPQPQQQWWQPGASQQPGPLAPQVDPAASVITGHTTHVLFVPQQHVSPAATVPLATTDDAHHLLLSPYQHRPTASTAAHSAPGHATALSRPQQPLADSNPHPGPVGNTPAPACTKCLDLESQCATLRADLQARGSQLLEARAALQEAVEREARLMGELQLCQETLNIQDRDFRTQEQQLELALRTLHHHVCPRAQESGLELKDIDAVVADLSRRVRTLVASQGCQERDLGHLQAELSKAQQQLAAQAYEYQDSHREAQALRDRMERDHAQALAEAERQKQELRANHHAQVTSLHQQIRALEAELQTAADHQAQQEEYGRKLERKLAVAMEDARAGQDAIQRLEEVREEMGTLRTRLAGMEKLKSKLQRLEEEAQEQVASLSARDAQVSLLAPELAKARSHLEDQSELLALKDRQIQSLTKKLDDMKAGYATSQSQQQSLQEEVASLRHELHRLHTQHHSLQAAHRDLQAQLSTTSTFPGSHPRHSSGSHSEGQDLMGGAHGDSGSGAGLPSYLSVPPLTPSQRSAAGKPVAMLRSDAGSSDASVDVGCGEDAAGPGPLTGSMFNDGTPAGIQHELEMWRQRCVDLTTTMNGWETERYRAEEELKQARNVAEARYQAVQQELVATREQLLAAEQTAGQLARDVARLQQQVDAAEQRADEALRSAAKYHSCEEREVNAVRAKEAAQAELDRAMNELRDVQLDRDARLTHEEADKLRDEIQDLKEKLVVSQQEVAYLKNHTEVCEGAITELEEAHTQAQQQLQELQGQHAELQQVLAVVQSARQELEQRLLELDGPLGPSARAAALEQELHKERQLHHALKTQMPDLLRTLETTRQELAAKESDVLRLEGTCNIIRDEMMRMKQAGGHFG